MALTVFQDTEFPGIVARPVAEEFGSKANFHYQTLRVNIDLLKVIQLGLAVFDADGEVPPPNALQLLSPMSKSRLVAAGVNLNMVCPCAWNFNFQFDEN